MQKLLVLLLIALGGAACSSLDPAGFEGGGTCGPSSDPPEIGPWDIQAAAFEQRVLELSNEQRAQGGCCSEQCFGPSAALARDANLEVAARLHARDMVQRNYFSHVTPDGRRLLNRATAAGFGGCVLGENIAQGQATPEAVVAGWMASAGHCANILSPRFTSLGVGFFDDETAEQRRVWVQNFGG